MVRVQGSEGVHARFQGCTVPGASAPTPGGAGDISCVSSVRLSILGFCVLGCQEGDLTVGHPSHVPAGRALHADPRRQADLLPSVPRLWTSLLWCQAGMCSLFPLFPAHPHPDFHTSLSIPSFWLWCDQKITGHRAGFRF